MAIPVVSIDPNPAHAALAPPRHLRYLNPQMTTPEDDFPLKVYHALSGCQILERELKLYITEAQELAKKFLGTKMPVKMINQDYANRLRGNHAKFPLGKLIDVFEKLSDNEALVTELKEFKGKRNDLCHKGISDCLDPSGELDYVSMSEYQDQLAAIAPEAQRLRLAVHDEANKFRGHLYFDDISNEA